MLKVRLSLIGLDFRGQQVAGIKLSSQTTTLLLSHSRPIMSRGQTTTTDVNPGGSLVLCLFQQILLFHMAGVYWKLFLSSAVPPRFDRDRGGNTKKSSVCVPSWCFFIWGCVMYNLFLILKQLILVCLHAAGYLTRNLCLISFSTKPAAW